MDQPDQGKAILIAGAKGVAGGFVAGAIAGFGMALVLASTSAPNDDPITLSGALFLSLPIAVLGSILGGVVGLIGGAIRLSRSD